MKALAALLLALAGLAPGTAAADDPLSEIGEQCALQLPLSDNGCACVVARANIALNLEQQRLVVARVTQNSEAEAALNLSAAEKQEVLVFIRSAPDACGP